MKTYSPHQDLYVNVLSSFMHKSLMSIIHQQLNRSLLCSIFTHWTLTAIERDVLLTVNKHSFFFVVAWDILWCAPQHESQNHMLSGKARCKMGQLYDAFDKKNLKCKLIYSDKHQIGVWQLRMEGRASQEPRESSGGRENVLHPGCGSGSETIYVGFLRL